MLSVRVSNPQIHTIDGDGNVVSTGGNGHCPDGLAPGWCLGNGAVGRPDDESALTCGGVVLPSYLTYHIDVKDAELSPEASSVRGSQRKEFFTHRSTSENPSSAPVFASSTGPSTAQLTLLLTHV